MQTLTLKIRPRSAFGGRIRGDTLFGQLCWAARHRFGGKRLESLLEGYTAGRPFAVISDAFPSCYLPRPALPLHHFEPVSGGDRKRIKKSEWLPVEAFRDPLGTWLARCRTGSDVQEGGLWAGHAQAHNTIDRMTGTTGGVDFAPYAMPQLWNRETQCFDLYLAFDTGRIEAEEIVALCRDIGATGYGRDASIGLGKFDLEPGSGGGWPEQPDANAWLTLAPCAPQGLGFDPGRCWYRPFTRFGRHGDLAVHSGRPFKTPVLLADTAALLMPGGETGRRFIGQGLGGGGKLSRTIPETVQQGYAPVLAVRMEEEA